MSKLVFINTIPRQTSTNIDAWVNNSSGQPMKKTKIGNTTTSIMALYSPKIGGLANYISYTPAVDRGEVVKDKNGNVVMLQQQLEERYNLEKGYLTNKAWRKGDSIDPTNLTYFQKKRVTLVDGTTVLDLDNFDDLMSYYICLGSSLVANSEKEWRQHKWPKAAFYIALEHEADEMKFTKAEVKSKAFAALHDPLLTADRKRKLIEILQIAKATASLSDSHMTALLYEFIDKADPNSPKSNIGKFFAVFELLKTPKGRQEFEAQALLEAALRARVIANKQETYTWLSEEGPIVIGNRRAEAINFLLDPNKLPELDRIKEQVKSNSI